MHARRFHARLAAAVAISIVMLLASVAVAMAAPLPAGEPTLGLVALQQKLDASPSGTVTGYMKTVVTGSKIETIEVEVKALTGDSPASSLILFEAKGPVITKIGGIAAGMSGSPIYVEDEGVDKVIGAVSYGNMFTIGGTGLATPIEAMLAILDTYGPRVTSLKSPVILGGDVIDTVIISAHPEKLGAAAAAGAFVARPLSEAFIGGLRPGSKGYEKLAAVLAGQGMTVIRTGSGLSAGASNFSTDLVPGAGIGVLATRGDMWVGGLGTVTYSDGPRVLAFGHPAYWTGPTSLYMTNIWLSGIWPNLAEPTKMGYPTAVRGTITQDRYAGIMGQIGSTPPEAPVTAHATDADSGTTADSEVWMSSKLLDDGSLAGAVAPALTTAGYKLYDVMAIPGSASTTTTVVVSDGENEYTIVTRNVYDDPNDVVYASTMDAAWDTSALMEVLTYGLENPHIVSVNLDVTYTAHRRGARIVGVNLLAPLQEGTNSARVSFYQYGVLATQTVDVDFTVPEGTPLTGGQLVAASPYGSFDPSGGDGSGTGDGSGSSDIPSELTQPGPRPTIASIVSDLRSALANDVVVVDFIPASSESDLGDSEGDVVSSASDTTESIEATAVTPWVVSGVATAQVTEIDAMASVATYGGTTWITGTVTGPSKPVEVSVYYQPWWSPTPILADKVMTEADGEGSFEAGIDALPTSSEIIVSVEGGRGYTPAVADLFAPVRAGVRLTVADSSIRRGQWASFSARVLPRANGGTMTFQYWDKTHKRWHKLITKKFRWTPILFSTLTVSPTSPARCDWRAPRGTWKVRAVYSGSPDLGLTSGVSRTVTVKVR